MDGDYKRLEALDANGKGRVNSSQSIDSLRRCQTGYAEMRAKQRDRLYAIFGAVFELSSHLRHSEEATAAFYREPYWQDQRRVRAKSERDLFRDLWRFVTKAEGNRQNKRASKYAAAMEQLEAAHIPPQKVSETLRKFGGIECIAGHGLVIPGSEEKHSEKPRRPRLGKRRGRTGEGEKDDQANPPDGDDQETLATSANTFESDPDLAYVEAKRKPPLIVRIGDRGLRRLTSMKKGARATIEIELTGVRLSGWKIFAARRVERLKKSSTHDGW